MQNFKLRFAAVTAAVAALLVVSATGTAFAGHRAGHRSACCCQGQTMYQQHHATMFQAGDKVVVSGDHAMLMSGTEKLMDVPKGHAFQVTRVHGNWLGAEIDRDGKKTTGWIASNQVAGSQDRVAGAMPQDERRSFSYEPSNVQPQAPAYQTYPSYPTYRRYASPRKEPWQYPKTDPRRYGSGL
ncbi:MAG: hypothetical protein AB7O26_15960 [Planctomycetaceae bacterium]